MFLSATSALKFALAGAIVALGLSRGGGAVYAAEDASTPVRIAFVGDSMADGLWGALFRRLGKDKCLAEKVKLIRRAKNGTGLTRLDQYNWIDEVAALASDPNPDLFVGSFGVNDRQPIVEKDKARIEDGTPAFDPRYQAIVQDVVAHAVAGGGSMVIVGLPAMLNADANADAQDKNRLFAAAVAALASPRAAYAQPWTSGSSPEAFKPFLPNAKNAMVQVRASDGVHFTTVGYDMVMEAVYPSILASLKQRGRDLEAECPRQVGTR